MKKISRIVSLCILVAIFLSLCGCRYLDERRASRASMTETGTILMADGTEYIPLPECEALCPDFSAFSTVYIVEDEVPLLLIAAYGEYADKTGDGKFIEAFPSESSYQIIYYCRSDIYESVLDRIQNGFTPELYCYSYFDYTSYQDQLYTLTAQQADAVEYVLANRTPYELPPGVKLDYEYSVTLYHYTKDYLFRQNSVEICFADGAFYLVENDDLIYSVPNSLYVVFARTVKKAAEYTGNY